MRQRTVSIRGVTWRYFTLIIILALAGVMLITAVGVYSSRELVQRHESFELEVLSRDLGDLVGLYRNIAHAAAQRQEVVDILMFADVERAVTWAKGLRSVVPESIGVALIDREGSVLGEPLSLNLGVQCLSDLKRMLAGETVAQPPVHRDSPAFRHFDVVVPVRADNESLGLLFVSFSLNVLRHRLEQRIGSRHYMVVEDAAGNALAEAGSYPAEQNAQMPLLATAIPGTDWRLRYIGEGWSVDRLFVVALVISVTILVASLIISLLFSSRLARIFNGDLLRIRRQLDYVYTGAINQGGERGTRLRETASIMADVSTLVREIDQANMLLKQQSMHDSLTGLLNRRAFDEALEHYVGLAARGVRSRLVMLDLDLFKQINDRYGHAIGDEVLKALADTLLERCRSADVLARVGGDEFALIMPGDVSAGIDEWFSDIDRRFTQKQMMLNDGKGIERPSHLSAGSVVIGEGPEQDVKTLMLKADRLMYEAKRSGRAAIRY